MRRKVVFDMKKLALMALTLLMAVTMQAETISFTASAWASAQNLTNGAAVTNYAQDGVTVTFAQSTGASTATYNTSYSAIAAISGNTMTVSAPTGKVLTQAEFTMYTATMATNLGNATWSTGETAVEQKVLTWTGNTESLTVTFSAMEGFVSFTLTYSEPPVDPELSYNDTTTLDIAAYTAQWQTENPWDEWPTGDVDEISFAVDDKTVVIKKAPEGASLNVSNTNVQLVSNSTMTITAPYKIRKIIFSFTDYNGRRWAVFQNKQTTCSDGELTSDKSDQTTAIWTGNTSQLTITTGSYAAHLTKMVIICDSTDNKATVTFYDFNNHVIKSEPVLFGQNATAPTIDDVCWDGWDVDFTNVHTDLEVHPLRKMLWDVTIDEWAAQYNVNQNRTFSKDGFSITCPSFDMPSLKKTIDGVTYTYRLAPYSNPLTLKGAVGFNNLTIICWSEEDAATLAAGTWSNGEVIRDGYNVLWSGYTDSLRFVSSADCSIMAFHIDCKTITEYTVIFYDNNGNVLKRDTVARGGSATAPNAPEITGYTFTGWDTNFTNLSGENPFIYVHPIYEEAEGYVWVTFVDLNGNVLQKSRILIGGSVTPPEAPALPLMKFVGWDHELTNITEPVTIKPTYQFDSNSPDILTMEQWRTITPQEAEYYAVKGVMTGYQWESPNLEDGGTLSFAISDSVTSTAFGAELNVIHSAGLNGAPFFHKAQILPGDTLIVYGQWGVTRLGQGNYWGICNGHLLYQKTATDRSNVVFLEMPDAQALYDFNGDGKKQVADLRVKTYVVDEQVPGCTCTHDNQDFIIVATGSIDEGFDAQDTLIQYTFENIGELGYSSGDRILYIEDLNHDGKPEFSIGNVSFTSYSQGSVTGSTQIWLSKEMNYAFHNGAFSITNLDLNNDGRLDYLIFKNNDPSPFGEIAYQTADGSFVFESMKFVNSNPLNAPQVRKAKSIGNQLSLPMTAIDLNGDGLNDLVNEREGLLYINKGNGQWEWKNMGTGLILTDLNGDGLTDIVMPCDDALKVAIYNAATQDYVTTTINSTGVVDDTPFCYDFDKDGDIDILATFAAYNNNNVAYTAFFMNDGNGHFTKQNEQNYGTNNELLFSECQDVDGDGYYDLLAFKGEILNVSYSIPFVGTDVTMYYESGTEIVWLRGSGNNSFAAPQRLFELTHAATLWHNFNASSYVRNSFALHINAEDLDSNGATRIWLSGVNTTLIGATSYNGTTELFPLPAVTPNTRPTAPAAPQLTYNNGLLTVTWGNGADDKTATADLTYALRIGTTSGGNDIIAAHANADGTRRNFLDGNMGRAHSYTIDLRTYAPGTVYVAVQAIDAQHMGSVWSQEATVAHTYVPIDFTFSENPIAYSDIVEVHYTALPEGYTHTWRYADGVVVKDTTYLVLTFPTGGNKTITHIVTAPNGAQDSISHVLTVLPAAVDAPMEITNNALNILSRPIADYTGDGRMDGVLDAVYEGIADSALFQKALGMWNANTISVSNALWYDYNHDGAVDLLFRTSGKDYVYMLHDPAQPALTEQVNTERAENNRLMYLIGFSYTQYTTHNYFSFKEDMRHIGFEECAQSTLSGDGKTRTLELADFAKDGSVAFKPITVIGDAELFKKMVDETFYTADFDHDGFADIAGIGYTNNDYTFPELNLFYNRGNCVYEQGNIPFPEALPPHTTISLEDFNGDGFIDVLACHNNTWDSNEAKYICVYWNNTNTSFTRMDLPESAHLTYEGLHIITDVDNNGYKDVVAIMKDESSDSYGIYAWYMGAEGLLSHGYLAMGSNMYDLQDIYLTSNDHYLMADGKLYPVLAQVDTRPAAPTNIQATMTDDGLLLTWNAAIDDHTPAALMRYNLSMKLQGAETYLFSPQNGGNENAAYIPGYNYINATRFLIPTAVLSNGNYEIRLQAVDNQNKMSVFSETLIKTVERNPIEAPTKACAYDYTTVSYQGTETGTPVWNFGTDATIKSGSGFGPYTVYWQSGGEKEITLTIGDTTYRDTISVSDPYELPIYPPKELYEDVPATVELPEGATCAWYARLNDDTEWHPVDQTGILLDDSYILIYDRRLKAEGATITAYALPNETSLCDEKLEIRFVFTAPDGCTGYYDNIVTVRHQTNIPTLSLVTTNADGHNVISWTNVDAFSTIYIYKEGNTLNDFQVIGNANASAGSFIDANSDATQKAERYYITGVSANGESPASTIHKTVHLTINRGVMDGTFNLIWNEYVGASVTSYNILCGATPTSLEQIATVASSNTSYTDQAPVDSQPYYAIEYVLASASSAPAANHAPATNLSGHSNVVNRNMLAIEDIQADGTVPQKVMVDGTILILRGDRTYTLTGQEMK